MRRLGAPALLLAATLVLAGCGGPETNKGGMPEPAGGGDPSTSTGNTPSTTPSAEPTTEPTAPATTAAPPRKAQVIVVPGNYAENPAVQGLVKNYPIYFSALVARDADIVKKAFPAYFYADVQLGIDEAKRSGWVMRPPGSVVVMGIKQEKFGVVRVQTCRSQTTQYWDPKAKQWALSGAKGVPQALDMIETGLGWTMYKIAPAGKLSCSKVRFPA
ncbi:hypothetical protein GCM10009789_27140 [Kribbella sancticallisti]|uniref:Uncharacterized protein n=1 Tax=Kribbella sancticallisti TaxID=460087 RepID=A0ABN2D7S5_9ACTN